MKLSNRRSLFIALTIFAGMSSSFADVPPEVLLRKVLSHFPFPASEKESRLVAAKRYVANLRTLRNQALINAGDSGDKTANWVVWMSTYAQLGRELNEAVANERAVNVAANLPDGFKPVALEAMELVHCYRHETDTAEARMLKRMAELDEGFLVAKALACLNIATAEVPPTHEDRHRDFSPFKGQKFEYRGKFYDLLGATRVR